MQGRFWPEQAWQNVAGAAWPWIETEPRAPFEERIRKALEPYWGKRLGLVPATYLSAEMREQLLAERSRIGPDTVLGGGFEKVAESAIGEADSFWFFDLGCAAWILRLASLRKEGLLPGKTPTESYLSLEKTWATRGPAAALAQVEQWMGADKRAHPGLALYHVPLALWQKRDAGSAIESLDIGITALAPRGHTLLGETLPLTYGLLLGLLGSAQRAGDLLSEEEIPDEYSAWSGFGHDEVRYHRARYLWANGQEAEARELLSRVVDRNAAYVLRLLTDPSFLGADGKRDGTIQAQIGDMVEKARSSLMRWQHSRPEREKTADAQVVADRVSGSLRLHGSDAYVVLASAVGVRIIRGEVEAFTPSVRSDLQTLLTFAEEIPPTMPFHLGPGFSDRFIGTEDSDIARLLKLVEAGRGGEAVRLLNRIQIVLPGSLRMACISYATRLVRALATAADTLEAREGLEDEYRLHHLHELWTQCFEVTEPIRMLPDEIGTTLANQLKGVWSKISEIEESWVESEGRAYGQMVLVAPENVPPIQPGRLMAYHFEVQDAAGTPVPGVPVLWRVVSGPAHPKDASENISVEWTSSLQTGRVVIAVEGVGVGESGEIEAWLLGSRKRVKIQYRVAE